jgi:hypothetical protein
MYPSGNPKKFNKSGVSGKKFSLCTQTKKPEKRIDPDPGFSFFSPMPSG